MKRFYRHWLWLLVLSAGGTVVEAGINAVCDSANPCQVTGAATVGVDSNVTVTWRGSANSAGAPSLMERIVSNAGTFLVLSGRNRVVLGTVTTQLNQTVTVTPRGLTPFTLSETVTVPAAVSQQAARLGVDRISLERIFSSLSGSQASGTVSIRLQPPGPFPGGPGVTPSNLDIERVNLRFDNNEQVRLVNRGEQFNALADINYDSAGLFAAVWEVATPASTGGQPFFRSLQNVRQYLGAGRRVVLQSPTLPTDMKGLYLLRFRILQPQGRFEPIVLRYTVSDMAGGADAKVSAIPVVQPGPGAVLSADTEFRWRPVAGARAYQLELYERPDIAAPALGAFDPPPAVDAQQDGPVIAGVLIPAGRTAVQMSALSRSYLLPGRVYHWRVIAIGAQGRILAASALREIRIP